MACQGRSSTRFLGGQINSSAEAEVAFSPDGKRYAYCGLLGGEMVVMVDGKEFLRSSESNMGRFDGSSCKLGFTSNSQHVLLLSTWMKSTTRAIIARGSYSTARRPQVAPNRRMADTISATSHSVPTAITTHSSFPIRRRRGTGRKA